MKRPGRRSVKRTALRAAKRKGLGLRTVQRPVPLGIIGGSGLYSVDEIRGMDVIIVTTATCGDQRIGRRCSSM